MPKKSSDAKLIGQIGVALADHVAQREDRHGFSRLDALLGELETKGPAYHSQLEGVLLALLPTFKTASSRVWEAIRLIIDSARLRSPAVANCIIKILDEFAEPAASATRFQAFLAHRASGGVLTRPRLDREKRLHDELTPQWVDLVMNAYYGASENIILLLEEELSRSNSKFTWEDVRRRLPLIFRLLGPDFNRGIVRAIRSIPTSDGQKKLAAAVKSSFKFDPILELGTASQTGIAGDTTSHHHSLVEDASTTRQRMHDAFDGVVQGQFTAWKEIIDQPTYEAG